MPLKTCLLLIMLTICSTALTQSLEGKWTGYFDEDGFMSGTTTPYEIIFIKKSDTTYDATAFTFFNTGQRKDTNICKMRGSLVKSGALLLEEVELINKLPVTGQTNVCHQAMELYFSSSNKKDMLKGKWWTDLGECGTGHMYLKRKKKSLKK